MSSKERDKGNRGERAVVKILRSHGFPEAARNYADKHDGRGIDVFAGNLNIQVKYHSRPVPMRHYNEIADEPGKVRVLASKVTSAGKRTPWMVTLSLDDFMSICEDVGVVYE